MNEAKEKLQIEQAFGMAIEERLVPILAVRNGEQFVVGARREPWKSFYEGLSQEEQQAHDHIEICHKYETGALNYRMMQTCLDGGGFHNLNAEEALNNILSIYHDWRKEIQSMPMVLAACIDVCARGMTFIQASRNSHGLMSDKTAKRYVLIGLGDYVSITQKKHCRNSEKRV